MLKKFVIVLFLLIIVITSFAAYGRMHERKQLVIDYNTHGDILRKDQSKLRSILSRYPEDPSTEDYLNYVNKYTVQATYFKRHLLEYREQYLIFGLYYKYHQ